MKKQENDTEKTKIYLVENCYGDPNSVYIGKTKGSREISHKRKFGKQIKYTYIDETFNLNKIYWKPLETYWIEQFRQWGFKILNKNKGGGGPEFVSENVKKKISVNNIGKPKSKEHSEKISKAKKGCNVWSKGKKFSKEHCDKISKNSIGKSKPPSSYLNNQNNAKPVLQYDLEGNFIKEWSSIKKASLELNITPEAIGNCLRKGTNSSSGGFKWKYKTK
jgi:hypothetical protein